MSNDKKTKLEDLISSDDDHQVDDVFKNLSKREQRKTAVNSNRKGKRGERKICNYLNERFNMPFTRVPQSGAIASSQNLTKEAALVLSGDIICPENFLWSLEVKSGYDIDLVNLFMTDEGVFKGKRSDKTKIYEFIDQSSKDAKRINRLPMVMYLKDNRPPLAIFPENDTIIERLRIDNLCFLKLDYSKEDNVWKKWIIMSLEYLIEKMPDNFWFK
jgi:hypothetical protein